MENIIYRDVRIRVDGSICVIRKYKIRTFLPLNLNLASPYAAGMDKIVEITVAPAAMIILFLKPLKVSLDAES